jgi:hypothetical protein
MEESEKKELDPKVALLLEQTEDSLRKMEKTLGPDHIVVAQILDTYARLLRQHNHRILDAINMEARAKAIRAKHNQEESEAQAAMIGSTNAKMQSLPVGKAKVFVWVVAVAVVGVLGLTAFQTINTVAPKAAKLKELRREREEQHEKAQLQAQQEEEERAAAAAQMEGVSTPHLDKALAPPPVPEETEEQKKRKAEVAEELQNTKGELVSLVTHGMEFEAAGNINDAADAYQTAINAGVNAMNQSAREHVAFSCDELATAYERLSIILEKKGDSVNAEMLKKDQKRAEEAMHRSVEYFK